MAVTNIAQTLALAVAVLDAPGIPLLLQALDAQPVQSAFVSQAPLFVCTANITAGGDSIAFAFTGATIANLNLAASESRFLKARFRSSGPTAVGCSAGEIVFGVINLAGTLTIVAGTSSLDGTAGVAPASMAATISGGTSVIVTVVTGAAVVGPNTVCELYTYGAKGK